MGTLSVKNEVSPKSVPPNITPSTSSPAKTENERGANSGLPLFLQGGVPLAASDQAFFQSRFGYDFHNVRVHTGAEADHSAREQDALAYTTGQHLIFQSGQYAPDTHVGRRLLAHELSHVIQQDGVASGERPATGHHGDNWERQAHANAEFVTHPGIVSAHPTLTRGGAPPTIQHFGGEEHEALGDVTGERNIDLGNGVILTWGQIIALAGDYYASADDLRNDTLTPAGRVKIRAALEHYNSPDLAAPGSASAGLPGAMPGDVSAADQRLAFLALTNIPHFSGGGTSKETWLGYHAKAISAAVIAGMAKNRTMLNEAYFQEAFGQHFLTDSFSAGHVRTPRKEIVDYYVGTFAPAVVDHLMDYLRERTVDEIYTQVAPQVGVGKKTAISGGIGAGIGVLFGPIGIGLGLLGGAALGAGGGYLVIRKYVKSKIRDAINEMIEPELAKIGGKTGLTTLIGQAVGGIISGALHEKDNYEGLFVTSKAHPDVWRAFGDGKLDASAVNRQQAETAVLAAKLDVDIAYSLAESESRRRDSAPPPSALPYTIYFGFDHDDLTSVSADAMHQVALHMTYYPETHLSLRGHTDPIGTEKYNMGLGKRRAEAAKAALVAEGINPARISVSSAGEGEPVTIVPARYGRDRRVALIFSTAAPSVLGLIAGPTPRDVALENALAAVRAKIGPPYYAEDFIPAEAAGQNSPLPEWRWGQMDASLQKDVEEWVKHRVAGYVGQIATSKALNPIVKNINGQDITINPRPIVQGIADEILANPLDFLATATGQSVGP